MSEDAPEGLMAIVSHVGVCYLMDGTHHDKSPRSWQRVELFLGKSSEILASEMSGHGMHHALPHEPLRSRPESRSDATAAYAAISMHYVHYLRHNNRMTNLKASRWMMR